MLRIILVILLISSCGISNQITPEKSSVNNDKLKKYAFCNCINYEYPNLNDGSSSAYFETLDYGIHIFEGIDSITRIYCDSVDLKSKHNRNLILMKCLDYYNSSYLDSNIILLLNQ
jgi:hypothetical protein